MFTIGIITADSADDPSIKVFDKLASNYGCAIKIIDPSKSYNKTDFNDVDILYHRISSRGKEIVNKKFDFYIQAIKDNNLPYIGNIKNLKELKSKYAQLIEAEKLGIKVPKTVFVEGLDKLDEALDGFSFPVVVKSVYSFGGQDVALAKNKDEINMMLREEYIIQEFIPLDAVADYRAYVVGNRVVGGIIRENNRKGEFRANTTQGATATFFMPDDKLSKLALKYTSSIGAEILAVDFIKKDHEYYFIEANDAFSVKTENEKKKESIAIAIIEYCKARAENFNRSKTK